MKLRRGKHIYKLPPHSSIESVFVEGNQKHNQMASILLMPCRNRFEPGVNLLGFPTMFFVTHDEIHFNPAPDAPYVVRVRYYPPMQEC